MSSPRASSCGAHPGRDDAVGTVEREARDRRGVAAPELATERERWQREPGHAEHREVAPWVEDHHAGPERLVPALDAHLVGARDDVRVGDDASRGQHPAGALLPALAGLGLRRHLDDRTTCRADRLRPRDGAVGSRDRRDRLGRETAEHLREALARQEAAEAREDLTGLLGNDRVDDLEHLRLGHGLGQRGVAGRAQRPAEEPDDEARRERHDDGTEHRVDAAQRRLADALPDATPDEAAEELAEPAEGDDTEEEHDHPRAVVVGNGRPVGQHVGQLPHRDHGEGEEADEREDAVDEPLPVPRDRVGEQEQDEGDVEDDAAAHARLPTR